MLSYDLFVFLHLSLRSIHQPFVVHLIKVHISVNCLVIPLCPIILFMFGQSAFELLLDHHQVCTNRVGIIGLSFGVYVTLQIATQTGVKVRQKVQCLFLNVTV